MLKGAVVNGEWSLTEDEAYNVVTGYNWLHVGAHSLPSFF